jgi:pyrroloquinoline quinone biosynthesis protein E
MAETIGRYKGAFERKMAVAKCVRQAGLPLTVNAVCHRLNMDSLPEMVEMALRLGASRIEIANVQFHGWASLNQQTLLPTRAQVEYSKAFVAEAQERLKGQLVIDFVPSDYYATRPKACMGGWGKVGLNVTPTGKVLPCHAAESIESLHFDNVRDKPLSDIWYFGDAFNAYRGDAWMKEPCRSCSRKNADFGGCRCQALAFAGDAAATDPVCGLSPLRNVIDRLIMPTADLETRPFVYRSGVV